MPKCHQGLWEESRMHSTVAAQSPSMELYIVQVRMQDPALLLGQKILLKRQPDARKDAHAQQFGIPYTPSTIWGYLKDLGSVDLDLLQNPGQERYRQERNTGVLSSIPSKRRLVNSTRKSAHIAGFLWWRRDRPRVLPILRKYPAPPLYVTVIHYLQGVNGLIHPLRR